MRRLATMSAHVEEPCWLVCHRHRSRAEAGLLGSLKSWSPSSSGLSPPVIVEAGPLLSSDSASVHPLMAPAAPTAFDMRHYFSCLSSGSLGQTVLYAPTMASTQTLLATQFRGAIVPLVCLADRQTGGKGRGGNTWESPDGCLMFSFKTFLALPDGVKLPLVQYLVTLALVRAIQASPVGGCVEPAIKWPNDVYTRDGKVKLGGVLCESSTAGGVFEIVTGVGLNVSNEVPTTCLNALAKDAVRDGVRDGGPGGGGGGARGSSAAEDSKPVVEASCALATREGILASFLSIYEDMFETFKQRTPHARRRTHPPAGRVHRGRVALSLLRDRA